MACFAFYILFGIDLTASIRVLSTHSGTPTDFSLRQNPEGLSAPLAKDLKDWRHKEVSADRTGRASNLVQTRLGLDYGDSVIDDPQIKVVILTEINLQYIKTGLFHNWLSFATPYLNNTFALAFDCPERLARQELVKVQLPIESYWFDDRYGFKKVVKSSSFFKDIPAMPIDRSDAYRYGTQNYKDLMSRRPWAVQSLLQRDFSVLLIDLDTVWVKDPFVQLHKAGLQSDLLLTRDRLSFCGCFLFFNPTPGGLEISREWVEQCKRVEGQIEVRGNQYPLNQVLKGLFRSNFTRKETYKPTWDVRVLPADQFPPGRLADEYKDATVYHANWIVGSNNKVEWLKSHNWWHESDDTPTSAIERASVLTNDDKGDDHFADN